MAACNVFFDAVAKPQNISAKFQQALREIVALRSLFHIPHSLILIFSAVLTAT
jgi:hypothetical protein